MALEHPICELLLQFHTFDTPCTKSLNFDAIIGGELNFEARELLFVATQQRDTLIDGISNEGDRVDPRNVIAAIELYMPSIYKITHSMEQSATAQIKLNRPLEFSWTSALAKKKTEFKIGVLVYEVCFILTTKALALYNNAKQMLSHENPNRSSNLAAAANELKKGAGILDFVAQILLPRWVNPPENTPPEVQIDVLICLSNLFQCTAQRITVVQGILKDTPPSALAKLLMGISERYRITDESMQHLSNVKDMIKEEAKVWPAISMGLSSRFLGMKAAIDLKIGDAIGYLARAIDEMEAIKPSQKILGLKDAIGVCSYVLHEQFKEYKVENESIYFMGVPTRDRLQVAQGIFMNQIVGYSLPEVDAVSFASASLEDDFSSVTIDEPATGGIASWFGRSSKTKLDEVSCPPGYDKSVFDQLPPDVQAEVIMQYKSTQN